MISHNVLVGLLNPQKTGRWGESTVAATAATRGSPIAR